MSNYVMLNLDDPRANKLAEVMANRTCKKILTLLAEEELSESELATKLHAPLNTINYNMKKLVAAGLVERVRSLWSSRGRAVKVYRVSHKKIVISPKSVRNSIIPALIVGALFTLGVKAWESRTVMESSGASLMAKSAELAPVATVAADSASPVVVSMPIWPWVLAGILVSIGTVAAFNWFRSLRQS